MLEETRPQKTTPGIWAMVVAVLLLALLHLLAWMAENGPPGNGVSPEPCNGEAVVAQRTSRCSHPDHTGELVLVNQTTWLVCTCGKSDASTSDPKGPVATAASTD